MNLRKNRMPVTTKSSPELAISDTPAGQRGWPGVCTSRNIIAGAMLHGQLQRNIRTLPKSPLTSYCFRLFVGLTLSLVIGYLVELLTTRLYVSDPVISILAPGAALAAVVVGFCVNSLRRDHAALLVFLPPLTLFCDSWYELARGWSPSWSRLSQNDYVMNNLFGPMCGDTECL